MTGQIISMNLWILNNNNDFFSEKHEILGTLNYTDDNFAAPFDY